MVSEKHTADIAELCSCLYVIFLFKIRIGRLCWNKTTLTSSVEILTMWAYKIMSFYLMVIYIAKQRKMLHQGNS